MARIFISYRRTDTAGYAKPVHDALRDRFGAADVFMDTRNLRPGVNFEEELGKQLQAAEVALILIGLGWAAARDETGRRLDNPEDFVRREVGMLLQREIKVIPVLVQGATPPTDKDLPPELAELASIHALHLRDDYEGVWNADINHLIDEVEQVLGPPIQSPAITPPAVDEPSVKAPSIVDRSLRSVNPLTITGVVVGIGIVAIVAQSMLAGDTPATATPVMPLTESTIAARKASLSATWEAAGQLWVIQVSTTDTELAARSELQTMLRAGVLNARVYKGYWKGSTQLQWVVAVGPYPSEQAAVSDREHVAGAAAKYNHEVWIWNYREWCQGPGVAHPNAGYDKDGFDECGPG